MDSIRGDESRTTLIKYTSSKAHNTQNLYYIVSFFTGCASLILSGFLLLTKEVVNYIAPRRNRTRERERKKERERRFDVSPPLLLLLLLLDFFSNDPFRVVRAFLR